MGLVKWWLVWRFATRGKRRRAKEREMLVRVDELSSLDLTLMGIDPHDIDLDAVCPDCAGPLGEHLVAAEGLECP